MVRIFSVFADGYSPRAISEKFNSGQVPSPGARWNRDNRRKAGWVASVIHGNPVCGLGILNKECYRGAVIWNRSKWIRSASDSSRRRQVQNPKSEWIVRQDERLRIVSDELWQRVRDRQSDQTHRIGERVKSGMTKAQAIRTGAGPKFLLSSLLCCAECGSSLAIAGRDVYCCAGHTNGGAALCKNDARLGRQVPEAEVIEGVKREMRDPAVIKEICRRVRAALGARTAKAPDGAARMGQLKAEIANITDTIAGGSLRASPAPAARLAAAEAALERIASDAQQAAAPKVDVTKLLAGLPARARRAVEQIEKMLAAGGVTRARAREEFRNHVGVVTMEADEREIRLFSEQVHMAAAMLRAVGHHANSASVFGSGGRI